MKKLTPIRIAAPLTLLALVSACNSQPETLGGNQDASANQTAGAPPVALPPMVLTSHIYRCKDNSLAKVEFMSDKTAMYYEGDSKTGTKLAQAPEGGAYKADGYSVSGPDAEISLTAPGKGTTSCKS